MDEINFREDAIQKAKDKAEELINKFLPMMYCYSGSGMLTNYYDDGVATDNAKQCALLVAKEVLNLKTLDCLGMKAAAIDDRELWKEVINQINIYGQ